MIGVNMVSNISGLRRKVRVIKDHQLSNTQSMIIVVGQSIVEKKNHLKFVLTTIKSKCGHELSIHPDTCHRRHVIHSLLNAIMSHLRLSSPVQGIKAHLARWQMTSICHNLDFDFTIDSTTIKTKWNRIFFLKSPLLRAVLILHDNDLWFFLFSASHSKLLKESTITIYLWALLPYRALRNFRTLLKRLA